SLHDALPILLRGAASWSDQRLAYVPSVPSLSLGPGQNGEIVLRGQSPEGLTLEKALRFDAASYAFTLALAVADSGHRYGEAGLRWTHNPTESQSRYSFQGPEALVGGKLLSFTEAELAQGVILPDPRVPSGTPTLVYWAGYADSYFISAMLPS